MQHLRLLHSHEPDFSVRCGIESCEKVYKKIPSFLSHIHRKHPHFKGGISQTEVCRQIDSGITCSTESNEYSVDEAAGHAPVHSIKMRDCKQDLALMILKWQEMYQLPKIHVSNILSDIGFLVSASHKQFSEETCKMFQDHGFEVNDNPTLKQFLDRNELAETCTHMQSEHNQMQYFESNLPLVQSTAIVLGRDEHGKIETFQYVPILETLELILLNDDVFAEVMKSTHNQQTGEVASYNDGNFFKENSFFQTYKTSLQIVLYNDDFEVSNPIGTFTKKQKLNGMYFNLGNIDAKFKSKLHVIQLVSLCKSSLIQKYGLSKVFERLITDLQTLETNGMKVIKDGQEYLFFGTVTMIVADNLASHQIGGFMESFRANRICRFCMLSYTELKSGKFDIASTIKRTKEVYSRHVEVVLRDQSLATVYGVKTNSVFNKLDYFHVTRGLPSDPMHDLLEGVIPKVWGEVLTCFVQRKLVSLNQLNHDLKHFRYKGSDKSKIPAPLIWTQSHVYVKQTASQMSGLMKVLFFVLGDIIPQYDDYWQLLILSADICDLVFAPRHNEATIVMLHGLVQDFLELYLDLFKDGLIPKMHFLMHYSDQIRNFGPLSACSTIRFEAKHSYFKGLARKTKNRKNLCLTLAKRHQLLQSLYHISPCFLESDEKDSVGGSLCAVENLLQDVQHAVRDMFGPISEVFRCTAVVINGNRFDENSVVVTGTEKSVLQFSMVKAIFLRGSRVYFLVSELENVQYSAHYHSNIVRPNFSGKPHIIEPEDLLDFRPLEYYFCNVGICIPQRYRLLEEFIC